MITQWHMTKFHQIPQALHVNKKSLKDFRRAEHIQIEARVEAKLRISLGSNIKNVIISNYLNFILLNHLQDEQQHNSMTTQNFINYFLAFHKSTRTHSS